MKFSQQLVPGTLIKRYLRFLVDVKLDSGHVVVDTHKPVTAVCPNTGSLKSCKSPGWKVLLSESDSPTRKYRYTWEMVHNGKCWIGVNTAIPNKISEEAIQSGVIPELRGYSSIRREVKYGKNSRIDLLLQNDSQLCYVEVKNVTLLEDDGDYYFPDAVTERGRKHLFELNEMVRQGNRAVMLYVVQRSDGKVFHPAKHIDPDYSKALNEVHRNGVEILVYRAEVSPQEIFLKEALPWQLD